MCFVLVLVIVIYIYIIFSCFFYCLCFLVLLLLLLLLLLLVPVLVLVATTSFLAKHNQNWLVLIGLLLKHSPAVCAKQCSRLGKMRWRDRHSRSRKGMATFDKVKWGGVHNGPSQFPDGPKHLIYSLCALASFASHHVTSQTLFAFDCNHLASEIWYLLSAVVKSANMVCKCLHYPWKTARIRRACGRALRHAWPRWRWQFCISWFMTDRMVWDYLGFRMYGCTMVSDVSS